MTNPYPGDVGSIVIGTTIVTTKVSNYSESGGDLTETTIPTMGRRTSRRQLSTRNPYEVTFDFTAQDTTFGVTLSTGSYLNTAIFKLYETNPSLTITYGEGRIKGLNFEHSADDVLKGNIILEFSAYSNSGTDNRTVS